MKLPKSRCPVCGSKPVLHHERAENTIMVVTYWCGVPGGNPVRHLWEVRWSTVVAA